MNTTDITQHKDPLIDAYRQASVHDGARAGANVRAAVLAHARVVAQSLPSSATNAATLSDATRDATRDAAAANEARPLWRMAAGVVIGLVGVWIFQLTRPANAPDTTVAAASAPQADRARVAESAAVAAPVAAQPEANVAVAVAAPAPAVRSVIADTSTLRARADGGSSRKPVQPERAEAHVAIASAAPPAPVMGNAAAQRSPVAAADTANSEPLSETVVASAELRKSAKVGASPFKDQPVMAAAAPRAPSAVPNAFPAQTVEPMIAAAPASATVAAPVSSSAAGSNGTMGTMAARTATAQADTMKLSPQTATKPTEAARPLTQLGEVDQAMFRAVRAGDLPALRAAIVRGANVNARGERGRTTLQIAREHDDAAIVEALQAAGAR